MENCDDEVCCYCLAQPDAKGSPFRGSSLSCMRVRVAGFLFLKKKKTKNMAVCESYPVNAPKMMLLQLKSQLRLCVALHEY